MSTAGTTAAKNAYCPHCHLLVKRRVTGDWPRQPARCPHCQLLIGAGRARSDPSGDPGAKGTAAGVFSRQAKRDDRESAASPDGVLAAIRGVARELGERPERLLMVDYQQHAATDPELPPLRDVFAAFGSWKRARRQAADAVPEGR
jgi:hypothetical protein